MTSKSLKKLTTLLAASLAASAIFVGGAKIARAADQTQCLGGVYKLCIYDYEDRNGDGRRYKNIQYANTNWATFNWVDAADWYHNFHTSQKACVYKNAVSGGVWRGPAHTISPGDTLNMGRNYNLGRANRWRSSCP